MSECLWIGEDTVGEESPEGWGRLWSTALSAAEVGLVHSGNAGRREEQGWLIHGGGRPGYRESRWQGDLELLPSAAVPQ